MTLKKISKLIEEKVRQINEQTEVIRQIDARIANIKKNSPMVPVDFVVNPYSDECKEMYGMENWRND